jgi:nucleoside-diphosphate-sugar epimerase
MVARGRYFHVGPLERTRPLIFVGNISAQFERLISAAPDDIHGKTLNLGDYHPPTVREWADAFQQCLGSRRIPTVPIALARSAARVGDQLQRIVPSFPFVTKRLNNVLASRVRDTTETERICGPLPYSLEQGIQETVTWLHGIGVVDHGCVA